MPRGVDYKIPLADLLQAAEEHAAGWSLRAIARMRWRQWGYASAASALEGLRHALRTIDAPVRDRIQATIDASTIHGNASRAARDPGHPDHDRWRAHRSVVRRRPFPSGSVRAAHAWTSSRRHTGVAARRWTGDGKSSRTVYADAVRLVTSRSSATSESPTRLGMGRSVPPQDSEPTKVFYDVESFCPMPQADCCGRTQPSHAAQTERPSERLEPADPARPEPT